jgi:hypothetical protein
MAATVPEGNTVPQGTTPTGRRRGPAPLPLTAGRRAALAIGVPACLLVVAYAGLDLVATFGQGSFPVSYTAPSVARSSSDWPDTLTVTTPGGQIAVNGTTAGPARVTGTARYSLVRSKVTEHAAAGVATVGYDCAVPIGNCEFDATVSAPATVPVSVSTGGGNVDVTGTAGLVNVSTGGGNVSVNQASGPLDLQTTGGNIQAAQVGSAFLTATSGGGNIDLVFSSVPGDVRVDTTGGNVTVVVPPTASYHVTAHTDGGSVTDEVAQDTSSPNVITVTTGGGDITIIRG